MGKKNLSETIKSFIKLCHGNAVQCYSKYLHLQKLFTKKTAIHLKTTYLSIFFYDFFPLL